MSKRLPFPVCPRRRHIFQILLLAACVAGLSARDASSEVWRSPLHSLTYVQVEKALQNPYVDAEVAVGQPASETFLPLPPELVARLGAYAVDYESFTAAYLPSPADKELEELAAQSGLVAISGIDRQVDLPWHTFDAGAETGRAPEGFTALPKDVPGLYLVQFAYPIQEAWLQTLQTCGVTTLAYFQQRTFLVRAGSTATLTGCPIATFLSWIDTYRNLDRVSPELLEAESTEGWDLQFAPGTDLAAKTLELAPSFDAESVAPVEGALPETALLQVRGTVANLKQTILNDPDLLSVTLRGVGELSDERQGQIVAGNHNGTAPLLNPRYRDWLNSRGLLSAANQQTVCVVDTGYDTGYDSATGLPPSGRQRHPDLRTPSERLVSLKTFPLIDTTWDREGHGTMVAGIISAEGGAAPPAPYSYPVADPNQFLFGSGIAPRSKLAFARIDSSRVSELPLQAQALDFCRNSPNGAEFALIVNESWNERIPPSAPFPFYRPQNQYTPKAQFFDQRVLDGNGTLSGIQPITIVFSAGNDGYDLATGSIRRDSVGSPALAKNVIAVGATTSYRPAPEPPLSCNPTGPRPPDQDALHIARMANFSGRGKTFSAAGAEKLHKVRVKPDLVAPAVRVFSTVPFMLPSYGAIGQVTGCVKSYPASSNDTPTNYTPYTYGSGTSFAAPVVTGVAALTRKWFLDRGVAAVSPSLIKAALLATADDLGPSGLTGNDPRPSPNYGWGRVNLNRLTDSAQKFYVNEGLTVSTGQQHPWTRTIGNPASATLIVLVWSDPASDVVGNSQAALKNNLGLAVDEAGGTRFWRGNNFQENVAGTDTGYSYRFSPGQTPLVDGINNVEAVFIPSNTFTAGQKLTIKVKGESVTAGTQKFSVYAYNLRLSQ